MNEHISNDLLDNRRLINEYNQKLKHLNSEYNIIELKQREKYLIHKLRSFCEHEFNDIGHNEIECLNCGLISYN